jgi:hypothetical protein
METKDAIGEVEPTFLCRPCLSPIPCFRIHWVKFLLKTLLLLCSLQSGINEDNYSFSHGSFV